MKGFLIIFSLFLGQLEAQTEDRVPDAPENVHVRTTSTSATIWWDPPSTVEEIMVRGYAVAYGIGTPTSKIVIEGANTNSFTINRLKPSTAYVFAVNAYNEADGEDGEKVLLTATTQTGSEVDHSFSLWPPIAVRATAKDKGVDVTWEDPNPERREENSLNSVGHKHYIVQYGIYQSEHLQKIRSNIRTTRLNNLQPGREYEIAVKVVDGEGRESPWSIRDIVVTPQDQHTEISRYDWSCDFEKDFCGIKTIGKVDWSRVEAKNPKARRGSHYLSVDIPTPSGARFSKVTTPTFHLQRSNNLCFKFSFFMKESADGSLSVGIEDEKTFLVENIFKSDPGRLPKGKWVDVKMNIGAQKSPFKLQFKVSWKSSAPWTAIDTVSVSSGVCTDVKHDFEILPFTNQESEVDLLVPVEGALNSDPRVFRAKGIDGLPAIGIQRGVEIVVPYRLYLPRKFFKDFSILAAVKPSDRRGGYLFAIVNPFDTIVDIGVLLEPAGNGQTNISLIYSNSRTDPHSKTIASFLVPEFVQQWAQFALEVTRDEVVLYFKCVRYSARMVTRIPEQLVMDDAHKLYIASAGPIIGASFEGSVQELKILDDPAEAAKQCDELWGDDEGSGFGENVKDDSNSPQNDLHVELPNAPTPPPPPPPFVHQMREEERPYAGSQMIPMKGERGEQGPPGVCTQQCRDGAPGMSGPAGPEGRQGIQGQQGPPGPPGSAGPSGGIGPFDESGTRSVPGPQGPSGPPGSQGPQGVQGPRGETGMPGRDGRSYEGLTQNDIDRILRDPRVKGEKGECVSSSDSSDFSSNSLTSSDGELPPYDPHKHRNTIKGQKGERGDSGPMGPPGQPGQPGQTSQGAGGPAHMPVYQTTVELFAAGRNLREGSLVFVTSSQQLFIRVTNGWKEILLGAFHPIIEPRASVEPPTPHAPHHHFPLPPRPVVPEYSRDQAPQTSLYQPQHKDRVLHMIALNAPFSGNMRGLRGADLQCYRQARQAGFVTTFRAMLSSKVQDLKRIVHSIDHETPIVNLNGDVLFASWNDILQDKPLPNKPLYAFNRQDVIRSAQWMWHGSTEGGLREDGAFCDGWRTTNNFENGLAGELYPGKALIGSGQKVGCETKLVVLCVENMSKFNVDRILAKKNVHSRD